MFQTPLNPTGEIDFQVRTETQRIDTSDRQLIHLFLIRLEDHFIAKFGEEQAVVRAQMLFDACGPGRNIDPQILFKEDSEGDAWSEAINSLNL